jgi:hypothetical protein
VRSYSYCEISLMIPDVIDVLLSEYRLALVRKGFRRYEIDDLCQRAKVRLDNERRYQTGECLPEYCLSSC